MKIFQNAIQCPDGTILLSSNNYEVKKHIDANGKEYIISGGKFSLERSGANDYKEMSITENHNLRFVFNNLLWLTSGMYKKLNEIDSSHLESIYRHKTCPLMHKIVVAEILTQRKYWPKRKRDVN